MDGYTPLMAAAEAGHAGIVEMLIEAGCNVNLGKMVSPDSISNNVSLIIP